MSSQVSSSSITSDPNKPRKHRGPPARLSWPSSLGEEGTNTSSSLGKKSSARKRRRVVSTSDRTNSDEDVSALWVDRFTPTASAALCVAPKKVKEIQGWLEEQATGRRLLILVGSPGIGKSTTVRVLAKELQLDVQSWSESFVPRSRDRGGRGDSLVSVEQTSAVDSFEEFLQHSGAGFASLQLSSSDLQTTKESYSKSIILLEDLPNLHGHDAEVHFRTIMSQHLRRSQVPTVLIFSDVSEGKHRPDDLERLVDPKELYASSTTILQIHPVTKPKMKKVLQTIAKQQTCQVTPTFLEELHLQSRGDMRHAIMTLQFQSSGLQSLAASGVSEVSHNDRDVKLSTFHALGKLLYAKRAEQDGRSVLAFDPEAILERSDLGVNGSLRFLEYHSTDFFGDIIELSDAFELYSDAAMLLDQPLDVSFLLESLQIVQRRKLIPCRHD
jgi:cell cycle checkpoint protein